MENHMQIKGRYAARLLCLLSIGFTVCVTTTGQAQTGIHAVKDPPEWSKLSAAYQVSTVKSDAMKAEPRDNPEAMVLHLTFSGPKGEKVYGLFARPKTEGVYPVVLLLHGLTSNKETMALWFGKSLVEKGFAILALDAPHHGERKVLNENLIQHFGETVLEGCREYRAVLDWVSKRKDVDSKHIGLLGYSMGSIMGSILGGVEPRIEAFALCVGGDVTRPLAELAKAEEQEALYRVSPSLFIAHIAPRPLLMLNGKQDNIVNDAASKRLYDAAKEPKQQIWYESGHILPKEGTDRAVSWLTEKLKPRRK
jgi:dienelactone hydrolase